MNRLVKWLSFLVLIAATLSGVYWEYVSDNSETATILSKILETFSVPVDNKEGSDLINHKMSQPQSIYDFKYVDIDGQEQSMEKYRGHVLIVVNVASKCGFTCVNYQQLTELFDKYSESEGLRILAFPCNQFGSQEPLGEAEIKEFVKEYNVKYDMGSKINVNGDKVHPLWTFLKEKQKGILGTTLVKWNFTKFLVDKSGNVLQRYSPNTNPKAMESDILKAFKA